MPAGDLPFVSRGSGSEGGDDDWAPISDLMTGLMMVFMLMALGYIGVAEGLLETARRQCANVYLGLHEAFDSDFRRGVLTWIATISRSGSRSLFRRASRGFPDRSRTFSRAFSRGTSTSSVATSRRTMVISFLPSSSRGTPPPSGAVIARLPLAPTMTTSATWSSLRSARQRLSITFFA